MKKIEVRWSQTRGRAMRKRERSSEDIEDEWWEYIHKSEKEVDAICFDVL